MGRPRTGSFDQNILKSAMEFLKKNIHITAHDVQEMHPEYQLITCRKGLGIIAGHGTLERTNISVRKNGQRVYAYREAGRPSRKPDEPQNDNRIISHCLPYY